jgi:hypothetical protein
VAPNNQREDAREREIITCGRFMKERNDMLGLAPFCVLLVLLSPQERSLLDSARRNGGSATMVIAIDSGTPSLSTVATESGVILRGIVRHVTTRLSDDQEVVMTQFEITPLKVYKGAVVPGTDRPGPTKPLIVQRAGGEAIIDGLRLTTTVDAFPETESLREGEDVFLFLSPNVTTGIFGLTHGPFGAYRIANGQVTAMTKECAARRGEQPQAFAAFENRVFGIIKK